MFTLSSVRMIRTDTTLDLSYKSREGMRRGKGRGGGIWIVSEKDAAPLSLWARALALVSVGLRLCGTGTGVESLFTRHSRCPRCLSPVPVLLSPSASPPLRSATAAETQCGPSDNSSTSRCRSPFASTFSSAVVTPRRRREYSSSHRLRALTQRPRCLQLPTTSSAHSPAACVRRACSGAVAGAASRRPRCPPLAPLRRRRRLSHWMTTTRRRSTVAWRRRRS